MFTIILTFVGSLVGFFNFGNREKIKKMMRLKRILTKVKYAFYGAAGGAFWGILISLLNFTGDKYDNVGASYVYEKSALSPMPGLQAPCFVNFDGKNYNFFVKKPDGEIVPESLPRKEGTEVKTKVYEEERFDGYVLKTARKTNKSKDFYFWFSPEGLYEGRSFVYGASIIVVPKGSISFNKAPGINAK